MGALCHKRGRAENPLEMQPFENQSFKFQVSEGTQNDKEAIHSLNSFFAWIF